MSMQAPAAVKHHVGETVPVRTLHPHASLRDDVYARVQAKPIEAAGEGPEQGRDALSVVAGVRELPPRPALNTLTCEYVGTIAVGVIDPAKVTRSALHSAASITPFAAHPCGARRQGGGGAPWRRHYTGIRRGGIVRPASPHSDTDDGGHTCTKAMAASTS